MEALETILRLHAEKYPHMQPTDGVKLIYQNEFGGGHLIRDEAACLAYLRTEYASVPRQPDAPAYDPIGNGLLRVNLAALAEGQLEGLGRAFIASAAVHKGSHDRFWQKLAVLQALTREGVFAFDIRELDTYLAGYREAGCPAVSHSDIYRQYYHPAYRVVRKDLWDAECGCAVPTFSL